MSAVVDAVFGSYDVKNAKQWRDEDLMHREQQKQWREDAILRDTEWRRADLKRERRLAKLEAEKRLVDAHLQQLRTILELSAILGFFSIMFIQEIKSLENLTRFVTHTLEGQVLRLSDLELDIVSPFIDWWVTKCEQEWLLAYQFFRTGASFFLVTIGLISWIVFVRSMIAALVVSVLCVGGLLHYNLWIASKWRYLVTRRRRLSVPLP
ncbi:unnamed protein product [Peronospora belbahrii]|uniref:Uncharacterized protein n=1 Tax=Peronospora belbahrii TaxID=622444 RepID=A0AAU9L376_9STRA|nr:unnamed protein product [Peronospora belbahrii]